MDENDDKIPYTKKRRVFGDGEIRLGTYLSLNDDIYSLGFACLVKNELVDEVLLKEDAKRPKDSYAPAKTTRGSLGIANRASRAQLVTDVDEIVYEDEKKQLEWERKIVKIYEERSVGRTTILIHVLITAFCQATLVFLLFNEVVGFTYASFSSKFGTLTEKVSIICAQFICTVILHLS